MAICLCGFGPVDLELHRRVERLSSFWQSALDFVFGLVQPFHNAYLIRVCLFKDHTLRQSNSDERSVLNAVKEC